MGSETRFSSEWQTYNKILPEYEAQFLNWIGPLHKRDFKSKRILDAGCGNGRNSFWPLIYGAKSVYSFDHDKRTVDVAKNNLQNFKNSNVFFSSIYNIKFQNSFDLAFSIGVVHHLENPQLAIEQLIKTTKPGGKVLVWVYGYEGNELAIFFINIIRSFTKHLNPSLVRSIAFIPALAVYCQTHLIPTSHPYMNLLSNLSFKNIHSIVFDQLLPQIAKYYRKSEAVALLSNEKLTDIKIQRVNGNSWTVLGTKR